MTPFGARLRALRAERGMTLQELAAQLQVSAAYLSALEHGQRGAPRPGLVHQVCEALGLIWDQAEELAQLARLSHPRVVVDTAGLTPEQTALANRLAGGIRRLPPETIAALHALLDATTPQPKPGERPGELNDRIRTRVIGSAGEHPVSAQEGEQRQQRQAQDGRMLAFDRFEQVNSRPFQPIGAHGGRDVIALKFEIVFQKRVRKAAHGQPRFGHVMPENAVILPAGDGSHEHVYAATQAPQLYPSRVHIHGLLEPAVIAYQQLVAADHQRLRLGRRNALGFQRCQTKCRLFG